MHYGFINKAPARLWYQAFYILIACAYLWLAIRIVLDRGYAAQDFGIHLMFTEEIASGRLPWDIWATPADSPPVTNPPLLFILGALSIDGLGRSHGIEIVAILLIIINLISVHVIWKLARLILSDSWNIWFVGFVATLPAYVITASVYAPDALTILPFVGYC